MNDIAFMDKAIAVSHGTRHETACLSFLLQYAVDNQFSVAVWRLPHDAERHLLLSRKNVSLPGEAPLEDQGSGFIFAPFDRNKQRVFLPADLKFTFINGMLRPAADPLEIASHTWLEEAWRPGTRSTHPLHHGPDTSSNRTAVDYEALVGDCIEEIEKGTFEKVVPSRQKFIDLPPEFDVVQAFQQLCTAYPNALISFVSTPETGTWLGASPEILVSTENGTIFRTVALAGTQPYREGMNLREVTWTQKEIEEQALVERYVISCFKKIRVREYDEHGPKTVVAGNLLHLKSDFTVDMKAINFPQLGSVMLQLLHPTSAVCGMPLEAARTYLQEKEGYDREFYAGFLGPVNIDQQMHIFVNLRCMKILDSKAVLFAGAGVTSDSVASREFEETEMKLNTLLRVLYDTPTYNR